MEFHLIIATGTFVVFTCGTYLIARMFDPHQVHVRARVNELLETSGRSGAREATAAAPANAYTPAVLEILQRAVPLRSVDRSTLQQRLITAGLHGPAAMPWLLAAKGFLVIIPPAAATIAGLCGYVPIDMAALGGCAAGGIGALLPTFWLDRRVAKRHLLLRKSLPDFLDLMIVCLEGGLSLQETIRRVSDELQLAHPTLAAELGIVQRDVELGATIDQALKRFAQRTEYEGVRTLSTFIRESQRFGTNITEALRNHADMLRSQREQAAEEAAQKAAVKILLPTLLLIFPAIFVVLVGPALIQIQEAFAAK
jgi:tight adherence protein C